MAGSNDAAAVFLEITLGICVFGMSILLFWLTTDED